ncbi:MAG: BREX system ATP-binding protein BrxD [Thermoleophilaceae bacterium]
MGRSPLRRREIVDALRRGTVPARGLADLAVGLDRLAPHLDEELEHVIGGGAAFKAIRADYGGGKTFLARWLAERAQQRGMATSEVQISESDTPLHRLETVYRRLVERLATADEGEAALRSIIARWTYTLEEEVLAEGVVREADSEALAARVDELAERRLLSVGQRAAPFAAALRGYRRALSAGESAAAEGLLAWIGGQPSVAAGVKRAAGVKGELDHFGALAALQALLLVLREAGHPGLLLVLDEVETLQRMRSDVRNKGLNALRQLLDEIDAGHFPGLYLVLTGTPAFYDGQQGVQRLAPLAQRLHTSFAADARFDSVRAVQIRLPAFDRDRLVEVGIRVRDIYADAQESRDRITTLVDDRFIADLAGDVTGQLGGRVGIAPRMFLKKLVGEVLDRVDEFPDFDPRRDGPSPISEGELNDEEREARAAPTADDIELDLS